MSSIVVKNLGKAYKQYPSRWGRLMEWLLPDKNKPLHTLKWVLQNVSFEIAPGESVGIVGVNGAGKSTLLKMITGTTQPTTGSVEVSGRVAALLELGMGFHPDFTGRQNVIMAGQLQGMSPEQMTALIPEIEAFAAIGEYFDQPVRVYSSGMQVRVAFAVATAVKPEILIIDEALSVGDIAFQAKCMQRMKAFINQGVTIIFVSHAPALVRQICKRAIYLSGGRLKAFGDSAAICDMYQNDLVERPDVSAPESSLRAQNAVPSFVVDPELRANSVMDSAGSLDLEFAAFQILDAVGSRVFVCDPGQKLVFNAYIHANSAVPAGAAVGLLVADKNGYPLLSCNANYYNALLPEMAAGEQAMVKWEFDWPFYAGEYRVDIGIKPDPFSPVFYDRVFCAQTLSTVTPPDLVFQNFGGHLHVDADVTAFKLGSGV